MLSTLNFDLGEEIELLRDATRQFAEREIAPLAAATDRTTISRRPCGSSLARWVCSA